MPAEIGRPKSETLVPDRVRRFAVLIEWLVACKIKAGAISFLILRLHSTRLFSHKLQK